MLYIKVELWPYGDESRKTKIAEAYIANTGTGDAYYGNYRFKIKEKCDQESPVITSQGFTFGHERKQGVWHLIKKVLVEAIK